MAALNEILVGRFNDLLIRLLKITGGAPAPQLTPEVQPVLVLVGDDPENRFLKSEQLISGGDISAAVAVKNAYGQLRNPANSGLLLIVEGILVSPTVAGTQDYQIGLSSPSTRAAKTLNQRDSRLNPGIGNHFQGPGIITHGSDATADGVAIEGSAPYVRLTTAMFIPFSGVYQPGDAFTILSVTQNAAVAFAIFYRARAAQQSELV